MEINILVKNAKKGDGEAFITLIKQYENVLYRIASRILDNEEDVADALQEAVMLGYEKIHTLKKEEYFNTWICRILINQCNSILNRNKKVIPVNEVFTEEQGHNCNEFLKLELKDALDSLNKDYKLVMILYYVAGFNTKEISELTKDPEGTIKSRLSRAKTILRENYYKGEGAAIYGR